MTSGEWALYVGLPGLWGWVWRIVGRIDKNERDIARATEHLDNIESNIAEIKNMITTMRDNATGRQRKNFQ